MHYRTFLEGEIPVSEIGLGAWQLGEHSGWKNLSEDQAQKLVHKALDLGVNFFDTAPVYGGGTSEIRLGKALKGVDRSQIVLNTKFGRDETGKVDFSATHIRKSIEGSLKRMQTDYIDSVIIHSPPMELLDGAKNDHYEMLEDLISEGKIKAYGASIDSYDEIKLLLSTTNAKAVQVFFNIFHQDAVRAFDLIKEKKVGFMAKIPLDSGWLTGKYNEKSVFTGVRNRWTQNDIRTRAQLVNQLKTIIEPHQELSQVALAFCLANDVVSSVIPGSLSIEQLEKNIDSSRNKISQELTQTLYDFYQKEVKQHRLPW
jgi:aryl-alcohol dehydrogenase-like predicted oxidoreductase